MKTSDRNPDKRKQKNSFDILADDNIKRLSSDIQNMFNSFRLIEMLEEIRRKDFRANNWFGYNFIIKDIPIEEPMWQKLDSNPFKITQKTTKKSKEDMTSFDIFTDNDKVTITIDMPDAKKENIRLWITRETIEIMPNNPDGKYHRLINLPCNVKSKTAMFTFRNGILDIIIQREKEEK